MAPDPKPPAGMTPTVFEVQSTWDELYLAARKAKSYTIDLADHAARLEVENTELREEVRRYEVNLGATEALILATNTAERRGIRITGLTAENAQLRNELLIGTARIAELEAQLAEVRRAIPCLPRYLLDVQLDMDIGRLNYDMGITLRDLLNGRKVLGLDGAAKEESDVG